MTKEKGAASVVVSATLDPNCARKRWRHMNDQLGARLLIDRFLTASGSAAIERIADQLGDTGQQEAVEALLWRLGDAQVQDDPDTEDAVCSALTKLGLMRRLGNLTFVFDENSALLRAAIDQDKQIIPRKYFP
jgi:hypothetical protein